jgi:predicted kinase
MPKPFVLHLSGHSCAGKSTLEKALAEKMPGTYIISFDKAKWQLAGYDRNKDGPLVDELVLGFYKVACERQVPIIFDFYFRDESRYSACRKIAEQHGYTFASVELTAPLEVRLERFHKRVAEAKSLGSKISVTDDVVFLENAKKNFYLPENTPSFDTSTIDIEEIATRIVSSL